MDNFDFKPNMYDVPSGDMTLRRRRSLWDSSVTCSTESEEKVAVRRRNSMWDSDVDCSGRNNTGPTSTDETTRTNEPGLTTEQESRWATTIYDGISSRSLDVTEISHFQTDTTQDIAESEDVESSEKVRRMNRRPRRRRSRSVPVDTAKNDSVKLYMIGSTFCC